MKLEWMGDYRDIIEQLMKYCNVYAAVYRKELPHGTDAAFSYAQIQVVEYLLENEERNQNLMTLARRLGISYSTFSKLVTRLEKKGLLEKHHIEGNRKNIVVRVTERGRRVYSAYALHIHKHHFSKMFAALDGLPREYLPLVAHMLQAGLPETLHTLEERAAALTPVEKKGTMD